jgi:hypothetical protein
MDSPSVGPSVSPSDSPSDRPADNVSVINALEAAIATLGEQLTQANGRAQAAEKWVERSGCSGRGSRSARRSRGAGSCGRAQPGRSGRAGQGRRACPCRCATGSDGPTSRRARRGRACRRDGPRGGTGSPGQGGGSGACKTWHDGLAVSWRVSGERGGASRGQSRPKPLGNSAAWNCSTAVALARFRGFESAKAG